MPKDAIYQSPQAVQACHELLEWIIPRLDKFPRVRRYTLAERIENALLAVLALLLRASYSRSKATLLSANTELDVARHLWRLAWRLQAVPVKSYEHGAHLMLELGKQIGGWRRASERAATVKQG